MHLSLTEEQRLIVDSATSFLEDASRSSLVRDTSEHGDGFDRSLWTGLADLGWCGILLPEHLGGLGAGWVELVLLQEQLGRRLACVPYFDSVALAGSLMQALPPSPCRSEPGAGRRADASVDVVRGRQPLAADFEGELPAAGHMEQHSLGAKPAGCG